MQHSFIDKYSDIESFIHRLDPRVKIITAIFLVISIVFTSPTAFLAFALYALVIAVLLFLSKIPMGYVFRKSLVIIPFVFMIAVFIPFFKEGEVAGGYSFGTFELNVTYSGLTVFWNVLIKAYLSILCMILLVASTRYSVFLKALQKLKFPAVLIMVLSFMYRYIFVIADELMKMKQAKDSRSVGGSRWLHVKTLANMIGTLFVRSYERAESVYMAMCSRGFNGSVSTVYDLRIKNRDIFFMLVIIGALVFIKVTAG